MDTPERESAPSPEAEPHTSSPTHGASPRQRWSTGTIIAVVIISSAVVTTLIVGAILLVVPRTRGARSADGSAVGTVASAGSARTGDASSTVLPSPEAAASAAVPNGFVLQRDQEAPERVVFWSGPSFSEWKLVIEVSAVEGGWKVTRTSAWSVDEAETESGESEDGPSARGSAAAEMLVERFLTAIREDRPKDAQNLTIAPLHEDPASEQVSNGEFTSFTIEDVEARDGGDYWVTTTETWVYGTEQWRYDVANTAAGLRIRNLEPAGQ